MDLGAETGRVQLPLWIRPIGKAFVLVDSHFLESVRPDAGASFTVSYAHQFVRLWLAAFSVQPLEMVGGDQPGRCVDPMNV